jgi:hypothetical protein
MSAGRQMATDILRLGHQLGLAVLGKFFNPD